MNNHGKFDVAVLVLPSFLPVPLCVLSLVHEADFVHIDAEATLSDAASLFQNRRVKFLPIIVPGGATVLALISHVEILEVRPSDGGVGHSRDPVGEVLPVDYLTTVGGLPRAWLILFQMPRAVT